MACDFSGDHELREKMIRRFCLEVMEIRYIDLDERVEQFKHLRYREIVRTLILKDYHQGTEMGMLCIRFGMSSDQMYRLIKNYYDENCCS